MATALEPLLAASAPQATAVLSLIGTAATALVALIAAILAAIVAIVGHWVVRKNLRESLAQAKRTFSDELAQKHRALDVSLESARQVQVSEIVKRRAETYPEFYRIISAYGRNWQLLGKPRDTSWAGAFLGELLENNAKNGVFFSPKVYKYYGDLRDLLVVFLNRLKAGESLPEDEVNSSLYAIIRGRDGGPGLGSYLKDGVGGYIDYVLSAEYPMATQSGPARGDA